MADLDIHDGPHVRAAQAVEQDDLVQPVEEFGSKMRPHQLHYGLAHRARFLPLRLRRHDLAAQVGGHDDHGVAEIHRASVPIGEAPVVEHLQQQVEDVAVGLLDLVEEYHLIGAAAHGLGERAALVVADIAGRGADQAGDGVLFHVLRHVDADHRRLVVEEERGQRLDQLGLAHTCGAEEEERAGRAVRVLQAGAGAAHGVADSDHRLLLSHHALTQRALHVEQLLALALQHLVHRDAGPARDHARDVGRLHRLVEEPLVVRAIKRTELPLQVRNNPVGKFACPREIAIPLRDLERAPGAIELLLDPLPARETLLLGEPDRGLVGRALFQCRELLAERLEPVARALVRLLLERLPLDLELDDAPVELVQLLGLGIDLHPEPARRLVDQVDRLVGQEAIGDVAVGERGRRDDGVVGDGDAVMDLVLFLEAAQDGYRVLDGGLRHVDGLEAPRQRRVLLHMLAVFVQGGRADAMQLPPGKGGLEQVGGIHRAFGSSCADQRVQLVDEHHDLAGRRVDLGQHRLQALLELAAELCPGHHGPEIESQQPLVLQGFGHVAVDDPLGEAFDDRRLADSGLADDDGVVLRAPREHLHDPANFLVPADHRIDRAAACRLGQVARVLLERVVT